MGTSGLSDLHCPFDGDGIMDAEREALATRDAEIESRLSMLETKSSLVYRLFQDDCGRKESWQIIAKLKGIENGKKN